MFEAQVSTAQGWMPLECSCAAGRALFLTEAATLAAIAAHLGHGGAEGREAQYRASAAEAVPA